MQWPLQALQFLLTEKIKPLWHAHEAIYFSDVRGHPFPMHCHMCMAMTLSDISEQEIKLMKEEKLSQSEWNREQHKSPREICRPLTGAECFCRAHDWSHLLFKLLLLNSWQLLCCCLRRFTDISRQGLFITAKRYITSSSLPLFVGSFFLSFCKKLLD